jgi:hypothetical protein
MAQADVLAGIELVGRAVLPEVRRAASREEVPERGRL